MGAIKKWIADHPNIWEFILFNVLSNISTNTRFVCTWVGTALFINALGLTTPFKFLIFDYTTSGVGGFITYLIAEVAAQVVNFFVQKNWVFKSNADFSTAAPRFAVLAVVIIVVNLILPDYVIRFCSSIGFGDAISSTIASVVNTLLAVVVSYPLLKFWVMPKDKKAEA